jgi:hypothetical protein
MLTDSRQTEPSIQSRTRCCLSELSCGNDSHTPWRAICIAVLGCWLAISSHVAHATNITTTNWSISSSPTLTSEIRPGKFTGDESIKNLLGAKEPLITTPPATGSLGNSSIRVTRNLTWQPTRTEIHSKSTSVEWDSSALSDFELRDLAKQPSTTKWQTESVAARSKMQSAENLQFRPRSQHQITETEALKISTVVTPSIRALSASAPDRTPQNRGKPANTKSSQPPRSVTPEPKRSPVQPRRMTSSDGQAHPSSQSATASTLTKPQRKSKEPSTTFAIAQPTIPLTRYQKQVQNKIRHVLKMYYKRPLNSRDHDPWEIMHGMLSYGVHSRILQNGPRGKPITAVGWLCYNRPCKNKTLLYVNNDNELRARWGVGLQGHYGQFLAMLAQCRVTDNYPIRVNNQQFSVDDLIAAEKKTCHAGEELSFKLIGLMHYCPSDVVWVNERGSKWDIPRLIREELKQPVRGAPCGGTHRLGGLSLAVRTRKIRNEPIDGEYLRAKEFIDKYERYALQFQNSDGSFSTEWFRGAGNDEDKNRRIKTSGHVLEWLMYTLNEEELYQSKIVRAVDYVTRLMARNYSHDWEVGPLSHAIHALVLYDERVFQIHDALEKSKLTPVAKRKRSQRQRTTYSNAKGTYGNRGTRH